MEHRPHVGVKGLLHFRRLCVPQNARKLDDFLRLHSHIFHASGLKVKDQNVVIILFLQWVGGRRPKLEEISDTESELLTRIVNLLTLLVC